MTSEQASQVLDLMNQMLGFFTTSGDLLQVIVYTLIAFIGVVVGIALVFLIRGVLHV